MTALLSMIFVVSVVANAVFSFAGSNTVLSLVLGLMTVGSGVALLGRYRRRRKQ